MKNAPAMEHRSVPLSQITPNPRNPRVHPETQVERLMETLREFGQTRPLLVRKANMMLIAGHGVLEAAKRLGWSDIAVQLWDVDQRTADKAMLADNRLSDLSQHDDARVGELLRELDQLEYGAIGYSDDEVKKLIASLDEDSIEVRELDTSPVDDKFWISVRGRLEDQAAALDRIRELLSDMPTVTIEIGTINV